MGRESIPHFLLKCPVRFWPVISIFMLSSGAAITSKTQNSNSDCVPGALRKGQGHVGGGHVRWLNWRYNRASGGICEPPWRSIYISSSIPLMLTEYPLLMYSRQISRAWGFKTHLRVPQLLLVRIFPPSTRYHELVTIWTVSDWSVDSKWIQDWLSRDGLISQRSMGV